MTIGDSVSHRRAIKSDSLTERIVEQNAVVILLLVIPVCIGATSTEYFLPVLPLNSTLYLHIIPASYTNISLVKSEVRDSEFQNTSYVIMWNSSLQISIDNQMLDSPQLKGWYLFLDEEAYIYLSFSDNFMLQLHPYVKTDKEYISLPLLNSSDTTTLIVYATTDGSQINITERYAGVDTTSTMDKQVFESTTIENVNSSTVLYLASNQPIGVFQITYSSTNGGAAIKGLQMLLPSCQWGNTFIVVPEASPDLTLSFSGLLNTSVSVFSSITQQCTTTRLNYCHIEVSSTSPVLITADNPVQATVSSSRGTFHLPSTECSTDSHRLNLYTSSMGTNASVLATTLSDSVSTKRVCTDQVISGSTGTSVISRGSANVTLVRPESGSDDAVAYMQTVSNKSLLLFLHQSNTGYTLPIFNYFVGTATSAVCTEAATTSTTQQTVRNSGSSGGVYERPNYGLVVGISLATSIFLVVLVIGGFLLVEIFQRRKQFSRTKVTPLVS